LKGSELSKIILGIDPGTVLTGYGIIKVLGTTVSAIDYGCIRPPKEALLSFRYLAIFRSIEELLEKCRPDCVVVETQFVKKNVQSAIKLGMARAAVLIPAAKHKVQIREYSPTKAKRAVVGRGQASKKQVQEMVKQILKLSTIPPEDAADALALAICHSWNQT